MQEGLITPAPGAVSCLSGGPGPQGRGLARARTTTTDLVYTVVIPAYNEGLRIGETLDRVTAYLRARGAAHEVLVVDDGSTDDTAQVVSRWAEKSPAVRLVRLDRNRGKGAALREGVARSAGRLVVVTGVSGSGKSTLVRDVLHEGLRARLGLVGAEPGAHRALSGGKGLERVLEVDQTPVGRTPRSVPATYLGIWDVLRGAFAKTAEARARGWGPGRFSFNVKGGRCEACEGQGRVTVEMSFLPDVEVPCEACGAGRFTAETDEIRWQGLSPSAVLKLTFAEAAKVFGAFPSVAPFLTLMDDVGLGYLSLGQPATHLSGGEAQRLKLVTELGKGGREGKTLYVLDEPTTGLHGEDVDRLVAVLRRLVDRGDTVVAIEHDLDVVASADHVIDLGPEGGPAGGRVVAEGHPLDVAKAWRRSHTGAALRRYAGRG